VSGETINFHDLVISKKKQLGYESGGCNYGELLAFISYAQSNPTGFLALVGTFICNKYSLYRLYMHVINLVLVRLTSLVHRIFYIIFLGLHVILTPMI
jgi:hypothetical protein